VKSVHVLVLTIEWE